MLAFLEQYVQQANNANWPEFYRPYFKPVHDWRTYVPEELTNEVWDTLNLETRCALVAVGEVAASREEWD